MNNKNKLIYYYGVAVICYLLYFYINYKIIRSSHFDNLHAESIIFSAIFSAVFVFKGIKQNITKQGDIPTHDGDGPFIANSAGEYGPVLNLKYVPGNEDLNGLTGSIYIGIGSFVLILFLVMNILLSN